MRNTAVSSVCVKKAMTYNGRPAVMVVAWPVEEENRQQDRRLKDELYGLNQTLELYELAVTKKQQSELIQEILDFTGHFYQSSRVCLFLYDSGIGYLAGCLFLS